MASSTARNSKTSSIETQGSSNSCEKLGAERLPPPRLPAAEFPLKPMGVGSPKIWRSNEMKTSPVNRNESCSSFSSCFLIFLSSGIVVSIPCRLKRLRPDLCFWTWEHRRTTKRSLWEFVISVTFSPISRKVCPGLMIVDICWLLMPRLCCCNFEMRGSILLYIYTCIYYARGWWTSVYHFFQCSLGYQGCDPYPYGGFLKYELDGISPF